MLPRLQRHAIGVANLQEELPRITIVPAENPSSLFCLLQQNGFESLLENLVPIQVVDQAQSSGLPETG